MKNQKTDSKVETCVRMAFTLVLTAKVNIFDQKEVETAKQTEILVLLKKFVREFEKETGISPTVISLSSDIQYLARQQMQKEGGEYQSSDKTVWNGIKLKSGCNVGESEIILSAWNENNVEQKKPSEIIIA